MNNLNKMFIKTVQVAGFEPAIYGMRNPLNSWKLSDSTFGNIVHSDYCIIGKKDMELCKKLIYGGSEHRKFLRQIKVWCNIKMPRYWWQEMDTYKFGNKNSCSTMHKLLNSNTKFTRDDFVCCKEDIDIIDSIIIRLNQLQFLYNNAKKDKNSKLQNELLIRAKRILPESYLQFRSLDTNYEELFNIYCQRKNHKLKEEWREIFSNWCLTLPYFKEFFFN